MMVHEHVDSTNAECSQMCWSFWLVTKSRSKRKLHIILQLEEQPRICRRLMDTGSQSLAELRECLFGKIEFCWQARYLWLVAE